MTTQYANMLRQRMYESNQLGGALMGGALGGYGYEGAAMMPGKYVKREDRKVDAEKSAKAKARYAKNEAEIKKARAAASDAKYSALQDWYNRFKEEKKVAPTSHEIRIAKAELALQRAREKKAAKSKKGDTALAKSRMSAEQKSQYEKFNDAANASRKEANRIISNALGK